MIPHENEILIGAGLALHFLSSYGEEWRRDANRVSPWAYLKQDLPGWLSATVAAGVSIIVLPQLGAALGVEPPLGALLAGYTASSLGAKLTALGKRSGG